MLGCANLRPVARYPYVEASDLTLERELLELIVARRDVVAEADFEFLGDARRGRIITFPIAPPRGPATEFVTTIGTGDSARRVRAARARAGALPSGDATEHYDIEIPEDARRRGGLRLRVRYRQPGIGAFAYTLKTGAYWKGPIGELSVVARDPDALLLRATVEDRPPDTRPSGQWRWRFENLEPSAGVLLVLR